MEKPFWEGKEYSFFSHKKCEYFPCHKGADPEELQLPVLLLSAVRAGREMRREFPYTENGIKDCTGCLVPHRRENYGYITGKYRELAQMMKEQRERRESEPAEK